jgi:hypothetical protein
LWDVHLLMSLVENSGFVNRGTDWCAVVCTVMSTGFGRIVQQLFLPAIQRCVDMLTGILDS